MLLLVAVTAGGCGRIGFESTGTSGDGGSDALAATPGCIAGETPGPFTSDFDTGVPPFGAIYQTAPAQMDVFAGELRGRPAITSGGDTFAGFEVMVADYRSRRAFVEIPTMVNTAGCAQVSFVIQDDDAVQYAELAQSCDLVEAMLWIGSAPTVLGSVAYDATQHRWWQLRAAGGSLSFELSPDGVVWSTLASVPTPAYFDDAYLELAAGTYALETEPIGEARFDNLFDCTR